MKLAELAEDVPRSQRRKVTVGSFAKAVTKAMIKGRIQATYKVMNGALHELQQEKRKLGYCYKGISCMRRLDASGKCAIHDDPKRKKRKLLQYETEYGQIRIREIEAEKRAKKRAAKKEKEAA